MKIFNLHESFQKTFPNITDNFLLYRRFCWEKINSQKIINYHYIERGTIPMISKIY